MKPLNLEKLKKKYPEGKYFIRRHNLWFRSGAQGYTGAYEEAGLFERDEAIKYLKVEGLTIHRAKNVIKYLKKTLAERRKANRSLAEMIRQLKEKAA